MDKQRIQAYVELIERLLACPSGQEAKILQANQELVDEGLVQVMGQVAPMLRQQGNEEAASWLDSVAAELARGLGWSASEEASQETEGADPEKYVRCWLALLQAEEESQGDSRVVHQVMAQHLDCLNLGLIPVMQGWVQAVLEEDPDQSEAVAALVGNLSIRFVKFPLGSRIDNLEVAIAGFEVALTLRTRENNPQGWAQTMNNLALAYSERIRGERAENLEQAIAACTEALRVRTFETMPVAWAATMNNLGNAYSKRIRGDRAENLEQAIAAYTEALHIRTFETMPVDWAETVNNLAIAYRDSIQGDRAENLEQAIAAYKQALTVHTPKALPNECRQTARSLGNLYSEQANWSTAAETYQQAIEAAETLYQSSLLPGSKEAELAGSGDLYRRASYALARTGQLQQAVITLEQGRARGLSDTLAQDRTDFQALQTKDTALYNRYTDTIDQLRQLQAEDRLQNTTTTPDQPQLTTPQATLEQSQQLRQELDEVIKAIRQVPGYESFLAPPTLEEIVKAICPGQPLIYLNSTSLGTLALLLHQANKTDPPAIAPLWFNTFTEPNLVELLNGSADDSELGGWFGAYYNQKENWERWLETIDTVTARIWQEFMGVLVEHLETLGVKQAVLIPTGYLAFLPLHAAWTEDSNRPTGRR